MNDRKISKLPSLAIALIVIFGGLLSNLSFSLETDKDQELLWSADGDSRMSIEGGICLVQMSDNVKITRSEEHTSELKSHHDIV